MTETKTIKVIKKTRKAGSSKKTWTSEQLSAYQKLVGTLKESGFVVRREELKRGYCWRVTSGACRSLDQRLVFVDSRLAPVDQIAFLSTKVGELSISPQ